MKNQDSSRFTLFQDRDLNTVMFPPRKPARFSSEVEGEGVEFCLRAFLLACLIAGMVLGGLRVDQVAKNRDMLPALPDTQTAVVVAQPVVSPAAEAL